jgi:hypothetical protein
VSGATVFESNLVVSNTTTSTNTTTGALVVAGGAGIAGNVYMDKLYTTNGLYWSGNGNVITTGGGTFTASASAPGTPLDGDFWYKTTTDVLYQYLDDGTSAYWVDVQTPILSSSGTSSGGTTITTVTESIHPFLLAGM